MGSGNPVSYISVISPLPAWLAWLRYGMMISGPIRFTGGPDSARRCTRKMSPWLWLVVAGWFALVCESVSAQPATGRPIPSRKDIEQAVYALTLRSSTKPITLSKVGKIEIEGVHYLYTTKFRKKEKTWYRLRLGFFSSKREAEAVKEKLVSRFSGSWVSRIARAERVGAVQSGRQIGKVSARSAVVPAMQARMVQPPADLPDAGAGKPAPVKRPYVINLMSSVKQISVDSLPNLAKLKDYQIYVTRSVKDGVAWNRLRVAGFADRKTATEVLAAVQSDFPGAWLTRASQAEIEKGIGQVTAQAVAVVPEPQAEPAKKPKPAPPPAPEQEVKPAPVIEKSVTSVDTWMGQARRLIVTGDYSKATKLLDQVLGLPGHQYTQEAQELLGLVYERQSKFALAEENYRDYLRTYPEGESSERVRQRLAALLTARSEGRKKLKPVVEQKEGEWELSGSFSQFSSRDVARDTGNDLDVIESSLFNDLDVTGRYRSERVDVRTQLSGSYAYDFEEIQSAPEDIRVSDLYLEFRDRKRDFSTTLGRQSRSSGGVLGRFDGVYLGYLMSPKWKLNMTAGYPVELSSVFDKNNRYFFGFDLDMGTFKDYWDMNAFFIHQIVDDITDRSAAGGEIRFTMPSWSVFALVDADVSYSVLNTGLLVANWFFKDATTINLVLDYRTTPVLTTTNALIGRTEQTISALLANLGNSEDTLRQLAEDRTSAVSSGTFGISHPFNPRLQISGDVTVSRQSGSPASGNVAAVPGTDNQYFYSLQLIGSSLFKQGDISILGLRYSEIDFADTVGLDLSSRYPLTRAWRANPKLSIDYRRSTDKTELLTLRPSARIDYRWKNNVSYDLEGGLIWSDDISGSTTNGSDLEFLFELGYRIDY